jgi:hypothetical protein
MPVHQAARLPTHPPCRRLHRMVYRATLPYKDLAGVCAGLQRKRAVTLTATRGTGESAVTETVQASDWVVCSVQLSPPWG